MDLFDDTLTIRFADVLDALTAVHEVERCVWISIKFSHRMKRKLDRPEGRRNGGSIAATAVDLMSFVRREVDDKQTIKPIGISEVHECAVREPLMGAS